MTTETPRRMRAPILTLSAAVLALMGVALAAGGVWLILLGGSLYYLVAGLALLTTAWLLIMRRAAALWLYAALLLGTLLWAIWEVGLDFWSLAPRGDVLVPVGVWLLLPFIASHLAPASRAPRLALAGVLTITLVVLGVSLSRDRYATRGTFPEANAAEGLSNGQPAESAADWTAYGGTGHGTRYSSLRQITSNNVKNLRLAWEFQTGDRKGPDDPDEFTNEATPLKIGELLYTCSPHQIVFALEAATGKLRWKFDPQIQHNKSFQHMTCRGVSYHETRPGAVTADGAPAPARLSEAHLPADGRWPDVRSRRRQRQTLRELRQSRRDRSQGRQRNQDARLLRGHFAAGCHRQGADRGRCGDRQLFRSRALRRHPRLRYLFRPSDLGFRCRQSRSRTKCRQPTHHFTAGSPNSWTISAVDEASRPRLRSARLELARHLGRQPRSPRRNATIPR